METNMLDRKREASNTAKENTSSKMGAGTMANGIITEFAEEDNSTSQTINLNMRVSGTMMNSMDGEFTTLKREKFGRGTKDSFRME